MPLPAKNAPPTNENVQQLYDGLTDWISDHPGVDDGCSFYENVDAYLGPWGGKGYPLGYGHYYCVAFGTNKKLQRDGVAQEWVHKTRIRLQELLRDIIVDEFRAGRLPALTPEKLKEAAFDSHTKAYDEGGLRRVLRLSPELIPAVVLIPGKEFLPGSGSAWATLKQAVITGIGAGFETAEDVLVTPLNENETEALNNARLPAELDALRSALERGRADYPPLLELIISRLDARAYPDCASRAKALEVIKLARTRLTYVNRYYSSVSRQAPQASEQIKRTLEDVCRAGFFSCARPSFSDGYRLPENRSRVPASGAGARSNGPLGQ